MSQSFLQRSSFDSWPIAKPLHRVLAFLIDSLLVLIIVVGLMKLFRQPLLLQNTPFFWLIAMWFWEAFFGIFTGSSPGKRFLSLEIYSPRYDGPPSPVQISLRIVMFWVGLGLLAIGILPILSRRDHRGWHDMIAETLVIGTTRSNPSPLAIRWVPDLILILSLLLFSGIGARIFSTGLKNSQTSSYSFNNCDSPDAFVKQSKDVLVGLVISPAFTNCWQAIETTNQSIRDAKIYQLAAIARKYHHLLLLSPDSRNTFYEEQIKPLQTALCVASSKECNSAGFLAILLTGEDISYSENYFADDAALLQAIANGNIQEKIASLVDDTPEGRRKTYLKELWIGLEPKRLSKIALVSNNRDWVQAVDCLRRLNDNLTTSNCDTMQMAKYAVDQAKLHNFEPIDDYLAKQPRDFIYEELKGLKEYFMATMNGNEATANTFMSYYPMDAVFRTNVLQK